MKKRVFLTAALSICILLSVSVSNINAAETFYNCNLNRIGSGWGYVCLELTDEGGAFSNKWFYIPGNTDKGKQMLATALTTVSLGYKVLIYADHVTVPSGYPGPTIAGVYLTNQ